MVTKSFQGHGRELIVIRGRVTDLIREILDLMEEIAESEVDSFNLADPLPNGSVGERLAELVRQLQLLFTIELDERQMRIASIDGAPDMCPTGDLDAEHDALLAQINRVFDLTRAPLRPASTWTDIEFSFRGFAAQLHDHRLREDGLLRQTAAGQAAMN